MELDKKDWDLITWALIAYKNEGRVKESDFERTYDKVKNLM